MIREQLGEEWFEILKDEFEKDYFKELNKFLEEERKTKIIYPTPENIFNAYKYTPYSKVKVCIIGQDPYIREEQAHGLSFSVENGKGTPSLRQIRESVRKIKPGEDEQDQHFEWSNNLTRWTEQGVMLLNKVLTVEKGKSNSHKGKGWEYFTLRTIQELDKKGDIIFLLWGKDAQNAIPYIKNSKYIACEHPVAASYQGRDWDNKDCFSEVNKHFKEKIEW